MEMNQLDPLELENNQNQQTDIYNIQLKKAVEKVCQKWFAGEITDPRALKQIDEFAMKKLGAVKMDHHGEMLTIIKKESVALLIEQLKNNELILISSYLTKKAYLVLGCVKFTNEQKDALLQEMVLPNFKEGKLNQDDMGKCKSIITVPLEKINKILEKGKRPYCSFYKEDSIETIKDENTDTLTQNTIQNN